MLRMSKLADYGTVVMTCIARMPGRRLSAAEIAETVGLEVPTVSKLLKLLLRAGLLTSQRGARGGYGLSRAPEEISAAAIIAAIEGYPLGLTECSSMPGLCTRELSCAVPLVNGVCPAGQITLFGLGEMLVFILILLVGFIYVWKKGALQWD